MQFILKTLKILIQSNKSSSKYNVKEIFLKCKVQKSIKGILL